MWAVLPEWALASPISVLFLCYSWSHRREQRYSKINRMRHWCTQPPNKGAAGACGWLRTHCEVHLLDGLVQVFKSHGHRVLRVIQVAEVGHDDFCTFLKEGRFTSQKQVERTLLPTNLK